MHYFRYNKADNKLYSFADDVHPRYITAMTNLDYDTVAAGDKFGNFFVLRLPPDVSAQVGWLGSWLAGWWQGEAGQLQTACWICVCVCLHPPLEWFGGLGQQHWGSLVFRLVGFTHASTLSPAGPHLPPPPPPNKTHTSSSHFVTPPRLRRTPLVASWQHRWASWVVPPTSWRT